MLLPKLRLAEALDGLSLKSSVKNSVYLIAIIIFIALILLPPVLGIIIKWSTMQNVLNEPDLTARALTAIQNSFIIAILVSLLDIATGMPLAWLIARGKSKWLNVLDTLADVPFIVPTAALGYSLLLFWSEPDGISSFFGASLISPGWLLVALLHFTFSYPVIVRVMVGALLDYKMEYERASRTLGAPPLTAARTVTFPMLKPSIIAAFILAFARSISETGATMIVAGLAFENGPVYIQKIKDAYGAGVLSKVTYEGATVFASLILIIISFVIFAIVRIAGQKLKVPQNRVWPSMERRLSYSKAEKSRNGVTLLIFFLIVIVPSLFVALPAFEALFTKTLSDAFSSTGIWSDYWQSLLTSYLLGAVVTVLNILIGLPMAILIARKKLGSFLSTALDLLVNVPLIVPSIALGASLAFFWKENFSFIPEMWLLIFAHLAITYPYFVRSMSAAVERIGVDLEEASRSLGAKPFTVFRTIILPLTKYSILSGAILVFTRSVSETGATLAVVSTMKTAPVVIVNWVKTKGLASSFDIGLGCGLLILFSFIILLALRFIAKGKGRY